MPAGTFQANFSYAAMMSVFAIFLLELFAYRIGVEMFEKMGIELHDTHGPGTAHVSAV